MINRSRLFWEKFPAWIVGFCLLGLTFWTFRYSFMPADPVGPNLLLGFNGVSFALFAVISAIFVSGLTLVSRSTGALFAIFLGMLGVSLRSGALYENISIPSQTQSIYLSLIYEMLFLGGLAIILTNLVLGCRKGFKKKFPQYAWQPLFHRLDKREISWLNKYADEQDDINTFLRQYPILIQGDFVNHKPGFKRTKSFELQELGGFVVIIASVGLFCATFLMRSPERGQVIFSLLGGFLVAGFVAGKMFPTNKTYLAWVGVFIAGLIVYALAYLTQANVPLLDVRPQFQVLPIDWFSAGSAGALLGAWMNQRAGDICVVELIENNINDDNPIESDDQNTEN